MEETREFKGLWIPKEIWLSRELTMHEKVLLAEINVLSRANGCWAQNQHFAEFFGISERRVQVILKALKEKGYIRIEYIYKTGTREIKGRTILLTGKAFPQPPVFYGEPDVQGGEESDAKGVKDPSGGGEECFAGVVKDASQGGDENGAVENTVIREQSYERTKERKKAAKAALTPPVLDFSETHFSQAMQTKILEWIQYKTEKAILERKKYVYTPTGLKNLIAQIQNNADRYGEVAVAELIDICIGSGYQGIIFDKLRERPERRRQQPQPEIEGFPQTFNEFGGHTSAAAMFKPRGGNP